MKFLESQYGQVDPGTGRLVGHQPPNLPEPSFRVVLYQPEIPQNTGNIGRTCVAVNAELQLVGPLGFEITDKNLRRAGLDYWQYLRWQYHPHGSDLMSLVRNPVRTFYFSAKAQHSYLETPFQMGDTFVFGCETKGLPEDILLQAGAQALKIPMYGPVRGLNLATAVAIVLYEACRQCPPPAANC